VSSGILVGDVSRRAADAVVARVDAEVWREEGRATVIRQSNVPQGFTALEFGHERLVEIDGLQLARIRVSEKNTDASQDVYSETDGIF
jgi:hypothetical protein